MKTSRSYLVVAILGACAAGACLAVWAIAGSWQGPRPALNGIDAACGEPSAETNRSNEARGLPGNSTPGNKPEAGSSHKPQGKHAEFYSDARLEARVGYLRQLAAAHTEEWDSDFLWRLILVPEGGELAKAAMETSILIAELNADDSLERVVPRALNVPSAEVRQAALRFVAHHNCPGNAATLLEHYDKYPEDRAIALATIACVAHADAQIHVLNVASTDETPRDLRIRAIALLAKAQSEAAVDLLESLSRSEDEQISQTAVQALKSYHR